MGYPVPVTGLVKSVAVLAVHHLQFFTVHSNKITEFLFFQLHISLFTSFHKQTLVQTFHEFLHQELAEN